MGEDWRPAVFGIFDLDNRNTCLNDSKFDVPRLQFQIQMYNNIYER